jgi:tetratricopeptide (TPR) repeat protein
MPINLSEALELHRRGHLDRAASAYEATLAVNPDQPEVLHLLGLVSLQRGNAGRAVALIGRAVALRPAEAAFHAALAEAYWASGAADRAIGSYHAALRLNPNNPAVLSNLAATLLSQGDVDAGIRHLRDAIQLAPEMPAAYNNLGNALGRKGDKAGALEQFRIAVRLAPNAAQAQSNLGRMLLEHGEPEEALIRSREALRLQPELAEVQSNLGNVLHALGQIDEAKACYSEAIRLKPSLAAAHAGLGGVFEELGDFDHALAAIRTALVYDPRHAGTLARLATWLRDKLPAADRATIEDMLADPTLTADRRWPLQFGLAQALDAEGAFDRSAALTLQANALQLADFQNRGKGYDPETHRTTVDRLIAAFSAEFFAKVRGFGLETELPVFIVGMPRSGTTLAEQVLASHPKVFGAGELRLAWQTIEALPEATGRAGNPLDCLQYLDQETVRRLAARHLDALATLDRSAGRVVDKMPENTLYLGMIATIFPRAKLIHCRRDLNDVALSCWMTHMAQVRWACDPDHIASRIKDYQRIMDHWSRVLPVPMFELDYEAMVADIEGVSRKLVAWCGLEWDPACLNFHQTQRRVRTASVAQVRQPVYGRSVGRWKNYEQVLAPLFSALVSNRPSSGRSEQGGHADDR